MKLGQLLSTRPDLIPPDFVEEFKKFHDKVAPVSFEAIKQVVEEDFNQPIDSIFAHINTTPLAAASIAQVHEATLKTGEAVVVKIQRPGIVETIQEDINVLYQLATLIEAYVPEARVANPVAIVEEFAKTLSLETNFLIEANNIKRISENFKGDSNVVIPQVFSEYLTERVLVMERLQGIPLSDTRRIDTLQIDREKIVASGLRAFFKMVFVDGLFHGDLHAGNIFILPENKIGLVDFGVVGRLSPKTKTSIANMLVALFTEDYEGLASEYLEVAAFNPKIDFDQFSRSLRDLLAPYYGMTFKQVNLGKILMDSSAVAARSEVVLPTELMLYFKAIVTVEGMGRTITDDFDIVKFGLEFAGEIVKLKYDPQRILKDLSTMGYDLSSLLLTAPRQIRHILRKLNSKDFALDMRIQGIDEIKRSVEAQGSLTYLGLVVASLIIASTMALPMGIGMQISGIPLISILGYASAFFLGVVAFYSHLRS